MKKKLSIILSLSFFASSFAHSQGFYEDYATIQLCRQQKQLTKEGYARVEKNLLEHYDVLYLSDTDQTNLDREKNRVMQSYDNSDLKGMCLHLTNRYNYSKSEKAVIAEEHAESAKNKKIADIESEISQTQSEIKILEKKISNRSVGYVAVDCCLNQCAAILFRSLPPVSLTDSVNMRRHPR